MTGRNGDYDDRVRTIVELARGPRILNVGACGNTRPEGRGRARFVQAALVDRGHSVLAADVDDAGLAWLEQLGFETVHMDAQAIPAEGELFDSIVAGELIEHLENPGAFLAGCAGRLRPGGRLVLSTPQPFSPVHFLHYVVSPTIANPEHTCYFDRQTLGQLLARCGFAVEQTRFVNDVRPESGNLKLRLVGAAGLVLCRFLPARFRTTLVVAARLAPEQAAGPPA